VTVETMVDETTETENKEVTLKSIPTVCCKGVCTPPGAASPTNEG